MLAIEEAGNSGQCEMNAAQWWAVNSRGK